MQYFKLRESVVLKNIERPALYDYENDDLYELDEEAFNFVRYLTGKYSINEIIKLTDVDKQEATDFINFMKDKDLIINLKDDSIDHIEEPNPVELPSLRTLLIHLTTRCNLSCVHCYLDKQNVVDIDYKTIINIIKQFEAMQGFKILISGGEPLLYPKIFSLLEEIKDVKIRKILFSNGLLLTRDFIEKLKGLVQEIQISVDGIASHNIFRNNKRSYEAAIEAISNAKRFGFTVSVATMIHKKNLNEFEKLESILSKLKVDNWYLDLPTVNQDSKFTEEFGVSLDDAAKILTKYGWGKAIEDFSVGYCCGAHLCAIMPNGDVSKCGFFENEPVGNVKEEKLEILWKKIREKYIWPLELLKCSELNCPYIKDCYGGCRYRAKIMSNDLFGVDKVKCKIYNFL